MDARANPTMAARLGLGPDRRELLAPALLFTDPPAHTRLRRAISSHLASEGG